MLRDPSNDTAAVPCSGCSKTLIVPKGRVLAAKKRGRLFHTFCSRRCERVYIAKEGARQQDKNHLRRIEESQRA